MLNELADAVKQKNVVLFVGAGLSMGLGLPSFYGLICELAKRLGIDEDIFHQSGSFLTLAEYYSIKSGDLSSLITWLKENWNSPSIDIKTSVQHSLIVDLGFPIIYTTNYDNWLENAHSAAGVGFTKIALVSDIPMAREGTTQIVKFHGDLAHPESIVLTESSYFSRLSFESPLDIKLRADFLGKSVLFLGYSLGDINLRYMIYRLHQQWAASNVVGARPKSYIFLTRPNSVQQDVLSGWGIETIESDDDDQKLGLTRFLQDLKALTG